MSGESETPNIYENLQIENKDQTLKPACGSRQGWLIPVGVILLGVVCFTAGFVTSYFAVPSTGKVY